MSRPRLRVAVRDQMQMRCESLDQLLPPDHPVRGLWQFVCGLDLSAFTAPIQAVAGAPGAPPFDPRTLIALWLQATLDGYGSARQLAALCEHHLVYRGVCGDDPVNHHTLSDFRVTRAAALDQLLTPSVAVLVADGGYRPAFHVQFATATNGGAVVGVAVTNVGSDANELEPMVAQLAGRYGAAPAEVLADGGFSNLGAIERLAGIGVAVFLPSKGTDGPADGSSQGGPKKKKRRDGPGVTAWRARMASEAGQGAYRERSATAEWVNALARNRGLQQFPVRGLGKATAVATWFAVAHNVRVFLSRAR